MKTYYMHNRKKITVSLVILSLVILNSLFVLEGFQHIKPISELIQAKQNFHQHGLTVNALEKYSISYMLAWEAGIRWKIAYIFIGRVRSQLAQGQLSEALNNCALAVRILNGYDDEGSLSYSCIMIEERIKKQLTPTPSE